MKGIRFILDEDDNPKALIVDLSIHGNLCESFYNSLLAELPRANRGSL